MGTGAIFYNTLIFHILEKEKTPLIN